MWCVVPLFCPPRNVSASILCTAQKRITVPIVWMWVCGDKNWPPCSKNLLKIKKKNYNIRYWLTTKYFISTPWDTPSWDKLWFFWCDPNLKLSFPSNFELSLNTYISNSQTKLFINFFLLLIPSLIVNIYCTAIFLSFFLTFRN